MLKLILFLYVYHPVEAVLLSLAVARSYHKEGIVFRIARAVGDVLDFGSHLLHAYILPGLFVFFTLIGDVGRAVLDAYVQMGMYVYRSLDTGLQAFLRRLSFSPNEFEAIRDELRKEWNSQDAQASAEALEELSKAGYTVEEMNRPSAKTFYYH